jgi:hypothetical protein
MNQNQQTFLTQAIIDWDAGFDDALASRSRDLSLSAGLSGFLLLEFALYRRSPTTQRHVRLQLLFEHIAEVIEHVPQQPGLWTGLMGPLYVFEYIRRNAPDLLPAEAGEFVDAMDDDLLAATAQPAHRLHYDLIMGLVGFGAYAIMRSDRSAGARLYAAVEQALLTRATERGQGLTWITPSLFAGVGMRGAEDLVDFGVAHGVAGVIGLVAGAMRVGIHTARSAELLQKAIIDLRRFALPPEMASTFPNASTERSSSSRLAWCYGDMGLGCALLLAAEALGDAEQRMFAEAVLRKRFSGPADNFMMFDSGLCHGHAGAWRMGERIGSRLLCPQVTQVAQRSLERIARGALPAQVHEGVPDLLDGHAGILLALVTAQTQEELPWDVCMNFGF